MVPGHDSRLGQVIDNLIDNARSFSPPGGTVRRHLPPAEERGRDRRRRRRPGHPPGCDREDLRALLHRPAGSGLRPEFRPRPLDLQADRRGAWRPHLGGEPHRASPTAERAAAVLGARFIVRLPANVMAAADGDRPRLGGADRRPRRADPRACRRGKSRLALALIDAAAAGRMPLRAAGRRRPRPPRSRATAGCWCARPAALAGLDRGARRSASAASPTSRSRSSAWWSTSRAGRRTAAANRPGRRNRRHPTAATCSRSRRDALPRCSPVCVPDAGALCRRAWQSPIEYRRTALHIDRWLAIYRDATTPENAMTGPCNGLRMVKMAPFRAVQPTRPRGVLR